MIILRDSVDDVLFFILRNKESLVVRETTVTVRSPAAAPATTSSLTAVAHLDLHAVSTKSGSIKLLASVGGITSVLKSEFVNSGKQILPSSRSPPSR